MPSFFETLRRPKALSAWADDGRIRAGESDPYAFAKDFLMRSRREDMNNAAYARPGGNIGRIARGQENTRPMNVVYNQAPEMAQKQFNFMKDQAALAQKNLEADRSAKALSANDEYIDNRRGNEIKQRQMDTNTDLAKRKLALELSDRDKIALEQNNALARIAAQTEGSVALAELNNNRARELNKETNDARIRAAEISAGRPTAANTISPSEEAQGTMNRVRRFINENPGFADMVEFSDDGKTFTIKDAPEGNLLTGLGSGVVDSGQDGRRRLTEYVYGSGNTPKMNGMGSSALGASLGSAGASGNIAERGSPTASFQKGPQQQELTKTQTNPRTGQKRVLVSRDGGATWQVK